MKKLLMFTLSLAAFSGLANAQVGACVPGTNYTIGSQNLALGVLGLAGCEVGDKIYSNFQGALGTNEVINFNAGPASPYTAGNFLLQVVDASSGGLQGNFNFSYNIAVDQSKLPAGGGTNQITRFGASLIDTGSVANPSPSSATFTNTLTLGAGTICAGPNVVTDTNGSVGTLTPPCSGLNATNINVNEVLNYTSNGGQMTVAQDSFGESNTPTSTTPEPVSMLLFGSGLFGLSLIGRKKSVRE